MYIRKKFTSRLLPIALCFLAILLAACDLGGGNPQASKLVKAPANKQIYTMPQVGTSNITLDPALVLSADQTSMNAISMIYTGLVQLDDKLQVQPQLAQSWEVSSDGLTYTFHLRHNLKFSDGTPLTSADVAYSINRALLPETKSSSASSLEPIKDFAAITSGKIKTLIGRKTFISPV